MSESDGTDDPSDFEERLDGTAEALVDAETEDDLDAIASDLDAIASDLEEADLPAPPEPEDEDEDPPPDPADELNDRLADQRDDLADQRGPYAGDVIEAIEEASGTIGDTEWAEEGITELGPVLEAFHDAVADALDDVEVSEIPSEPEPMADMLDGIAEKVDAAALDPDADAETIATLLEATGALSDGIDAATAFGDLPVREQLNRHGYFDVLGHYTDFPPEWSALKVHEEERNVEMILLAFDLLDSNFMEDHCIDALRRLGDERGIDSMLELAGRRDRDAIEVLGKIGDDTPVETFLEYIDTDGDPQLQQVTLKALGEIGSSDATEAIAQQLRADDATVRSHAARALGMIGDPRAIRPLAETLENDEAPPVRGSAAWALVEIGTADAIDVLTDHELGDEYLVEAEVRKVRSAV